MLVEVRAPFLHGADATRMRMLDAAIALLPAIAGAVWFFGLRALLLILTSVLCTVGAELIAARTLRRGDASDGSALVTGLMFALLLPPTCPFWAAALGALAASASKLLTGGLGKNIVNPAAFGRMILMLMPSLRPLALRHAEGNFLMGYLGGALGEVSTLLLLAGAVYLAVRALLPWRIAPLMLGAAFFTALALPRCDALAVLAWGGSVLGACYLASDSVTSPMGLLPQLLYALGGGILCTLFAYYGWGIGGVCCGILLMNLLGRTGEVLRYRTAR